MASSSTAPSRVARTSVTRRVLSAPMALLLLAALLPFGAGMAAAQGGPAVSIESQEAVVGDSVDVPVEISGFGEIGAVSLVITYDPEVLAFPEGAETGDIISGAPRSDFSASVADPGQIVVSWFDASDPLPGADQVLLRLTFSDYSGGTSPVEFDAESEIAGPEAEAYGASYRGGAVETDPSQVTVSVRRGFEDPTDPSSYKLVALPGQPEVPLSETVSGREGTDWRGFRELGASGESGGPSELQECTAGGDCAFQSGRGFWVISRSDWSFEGAVPGVVEEEASVPLQGGWNAISNPLQSDLNWADVQGANGTGEPLWRWSGGEWERASTFASAAEGEAYYVFNEAGLDSLDLPAASLSLGAGATPRPLQGPRRKAVPQRKAGPKRKAGPRGPRSSFSKRLRREKAQTKGKPNPYDKRELEAENKASGGAPEAKAEKAILKLRADIVGEQVSSSATVEIDSSLSQAKTYRAPPGHFTEARLRILGPDGDPTLAHKVSPTEGRSERFSLLLEGPPGSTARLSASGLEKWASCRVSTRASTKGGGPEGGGPTGEPTGPVEARDLKEEPFIEIPLSEDEGKAALLLRAKRK